MWPKQFWSVQNGFVLTNWFGLGHKDLVSNKMKWSQPKWIGQVQIVIFYQNESHLDLTNSFRSWPFHFVRDQIIMVKSISIWSHRRTRHNRPAYLGSPSSKKGIKFSKKSLNGMYWNCCLRPCPSMWPKQFGLTILIWTWP